VSSNVLERVFTRRRVFALSVAASLAAVGVVISSLLPGAPFFPSWFFWLPFPLVFVVHVRSVLVTQRLSGAALLPYLRLRPPLLLAVVGVLVVFCFGVGSYSIDTSQGASERHGDKYYIRDHTVLTRVSRTTYLHQVAVEERIFGGISAIFFLAGVLINTPVRRPRPKD
jgi:hypothetical protein